MRRGGKLSVFTMVAGAILLMTLSSVEGSRKDQLEKDITEKKKSLSNLRKEISVTRKKEKEIRGKETSILDTLNRLETELFKRKRELREMERELNRIRERLKQTREQISILNRGLERTRSEFFSRLIALYKMGRTPPETIVLTSPSFSDLLKVDQYMKALLQSDARLVGTYQYQLGLKERYQEELTENQRQWERSILEVERKKAEIETIRQEKQALLKSIQDQKKVYRQLIEELEERAKNLQALVQRLEREKSLLSYGKTRPEQFKGRLPPPVHGKVISLFRERGQNGIEIQAEMGTEIRAILPGRVVFADWFKGFGNIVIIDHGDHLFTVSGYCSHLMKKAGEDVAQGEAIALVGSAGALKGPSLYFEIRHQGRAQDPMDWISQPERLALTGEGEGPRRR